MFPRNDMRGGRRSMLLILVAALVAAVGLMAYLELPKAVRLQGQSVPHNVVPSQAKMFDRQSTLLVVGDSYANSYPDMVTDALGWNLAVDVQDGTGFVDHADKPSPAHAPFIERLDRDAETYDVDYVLVDGGRIDLDTPPEQVVPAADRYVDEAHARWPKAKIVVVLPVFADSPVSANYPPLAEGLRRAVEGVGGYLIDPLAQGWYTDVVAKYLLLQDGRHLNYNGETYYAKKIVANLTQMFGSKPTMLLIGDSFVGGTGDPNVASYPALVARKEGWDVAVDAQGGTGFVHRADTAVPPGVPFMDRLAFDAATYRYRMDYVLIDCGRGDLEEQPEQVTAAAIEYLQKVRSDWPNATMVIVLPSYVTPVVSSGYPALAEGLRSAAESVGARVIDPVAQQWYRGSDVKRLLWKDGVNLNGDGNAYYAGKIIENLTRMGIAS